MLPDLWSLLVDLDRVFFLAVPANVNVPGNRLVVLTLMDEAWRAYLHAASLSARQHASEPFIFCRKGSEAALYLAKLLSVGLESVAFRDMATAWIERREHRGPFDRHFTGRRNYEHLAEPVEWLYEIRSTSSEFGPHANLGAAGLHLLELDESVITTPFATNPQTVRDGALNVATVFSRIAEVVIQAGAALGIDVSEARQHLAALRPRLLDLLQSDASVTKKADDGSAKEECSEEGGGV